MTRYEKRTGDAKRALIASAKAVSPTDAEKIWVTHETGLHASLTTGYRLAALTMERLMAHARLDLRVRVWEGPIAVELTVPMTPGREERERPAVSEAFDYALGVMGFEVTS
jgi:hypothetical protein